MLEALLAATATTGLFALAKGVRGARHHPGGDAVVVIPRDDRGDDLPCPWCYGPTRETDTRCSGCGRSFG